MKGSMALKTPTSMLIPLIPVFLLVLVVVYLYLRPKKQRGLEEAESEAKNYLEKKGIRRFETVHSRYSRNGNWKLIIKTDLGYYLLGITSEGNIIRSDKLTGKDLRKKGLKYKYELTEEERPIGHRIAKEVGERSRRISWVWKLVLVSLVVISIITLSLWRMPFSDNLPFSFLNVILRGGARLNFQIEDAKCLFHQDKALLGLKIKNIGNSTIKPGTKILAELTKGKVSHGSTANSSIGTLEPNSLSDTLTFKMTRDALASGTYGLSVSIKGVTKKSTIKCIEVVSAAESIKGGSAGEIKQKNVTEIWPW